MGLAGKIVLGELELENFLSHVKTRIEFDQGVTAFVGHTGAGKSSIIDAIYFALRGESRRGTISNLINDRASQARVTLSLSIGGTRVTVERVLRRTLGGKVVHEALLREEGRYTRRGAQPVSRRIAELLGIPARSIDKVMIIAQGEVTRILTEERSERMRILDSVLGLDSYEEAYNQLRELSVPVRLEGLGATIRFNVSSRNLAKDLDKGREDVKNAMKRCRERLGRFDEERERIIGEIGELEERVRVLEESLREAEERYRRLEDLHRLYMGIAERETVYHRRLEEIKALVAELGARLRRLNDVLVEAEALKPLAEARETLEKLDSLIKERRMVERLRDQAASRLKNIASTLDKLRDLEEKYGGRIGELAAKASELEEKLEKLEEEEDRLQREASMLEERLRSLEEAKERLHYARTQVLREAFLLLNTQPSDPEEALSMAEDLARRLASRRGELEEKRRRLREELGSLEARLRDAQEKIRLLEGSEGGRCPLCGSPLTPFHREKVLRRLRSEAEECGRRKAAVEEALREVEKRIRGVEEQLRSTESLVDRIRMRVRDYLEEIRRIVAEEQEARERLLRTRRRLEELARSIGKLEEELLRAREAREDFELYRHLMDSLGPGEPGRTEEELREAGARLEELEKSISELRRSLVLQLGRPLDEDGLSGLLEEARRAYEQVRSLDEARAEKRGVEKRLEELRDEEARIRGELEELGLRKKRLEEEGYSEAAYSEAAEKLRVMREEKARLHERLESLKRRLAEIEAQAAEERERLGKLRADLARLEEAAFKLRVLAYIRERVFHRDYAPSRIREQKLRIVEERMKELLDRFNLAYSDVRVREDFTIVLLAPNGVNRTVDMLSGGEKVSASIAALLALHQVAMNDRLGFIIMDEPTIHLDAERRRHLIELLRAFRRGGGVIPQLIIVTHDEDVRDASDHVYEVRATPRGSVVERIDAQY